MSFISCGCAHENLNPCFIWAFMKMRLSRHIQLLRIEQIKISSARGQAKKLMTKGRKDATQASFFSACSVVAKSATNLFSWRSAQSSQREETYCEALRQFPSPDS